MGKADSALLFLLYISLKRFFSWPKYAADLYSRLHQKGREKAIRLLLEGVVSKYLYTKGFKKIPVSDLEKLGAATLSIATGFYALKKSEFQVF
jgi:hypothetical protein